MTSSSFSSVGSSTSIPTPTEEVDLLELMLRENEAAVRVGLDESQAKENIRTLILGFWGVRRENIDMDVLLYWESKKELHPQLFQLAEVVNGTPMTQVSVERCFSNLKFIVSALRGRLGEDIIDDVLVVRCNRLFGVGKS